MNSDSHPSTIPIGTVNADWQLPDVVAFCKAGPPDSVYSICPIIEWDGFTYWAYGYRDNRVGLMIVKYDDSGNVVDHWEQEGTRYVYKITVPEIDKTVIFWGEYGTIVMSWDDLGITSDASTTPPKPDPVTEPKIPAWVKDLMKLYIDGKISENEMINALQFLIKQGIIKV
ncbi:MAG: hypothetical protein ACREAU_05770 [Nitrosopumilaceae archaeon]